jgi:hypothetical protein
MPVDGWSMTRNGADPRAGTEETELGRRNSMFTGGRSKRSQQGVDLMNNNRRRGQVQVTGLHRTVFSVAALMALLSSLLIPAAPASAAVRAGRQLDVFYGSNLVMLQGYPSSREIVVEVLRGEDNVVVGSVRRRTTTAGTLELNHVGEGDCFDPPASPNIMPGDTVRVTAGSGDVDSTVVRDVYLDQDTIVYNESARTITVSGHVRSMAGAPVNPGSDVLEIRLNKSVAWEINSRPGRRDLREDVMQGIDDPTTGSSFDPATGNYVHVFHVSRNDVIDARDSGIEASLEWANGGLTEITISDGEVGTLPGCPPMAEYEITGSSLPLINRSSISAGTPLTLSGLSTNATAVSVSIGDGTTSIVHNATVSGTGAQSWSVAFTAAELASLADGTLTAVATFTTAGGTFTTNRTVAKDTVAPAAALNAQPAALTNSSSASFTFTTDPDASRACRLDSSVEADYVASCGTRLHATESTYVVGYPDLADGSHTFQARATDAAGNSTVLASTWTIDTQGPAVNIEAKPALFSADTNPGFSFSAEAGAALECSLSTGDDDFEACTSPTGMSYTEKADGAYTFSLRATDAAGNSSTKSYGFTIDTDAPSMVINTVPSNPTNVINSSFGISSDEPGATFKCALSPVASSMVACGATKSYSGLTEGNYVFLVQATDQAGNSSAVEMYGFEIDTTAPSVAIGAKPAINSNSANASFGFSAEAGTTLDCSLSTGDDAFRSCASSTAASYTAQPDGVYTFKVRATDRAGNQSTDAFTFTIDTNAPTSSIAPQQANPTNNARPSFGLSADEEGVTFKCALSGVAPTFAACSSPLSYSALASGEYTLAVRATDAAGNTGEAASYTFRVDTVAPTTTLTAKPAANTNNRVPEFAFATSEPDVSFTCSMIGSGADNFVPCASPKSYGPLVDGIYTFKAKATDAAGNVGRVIGYTFRIDTVAPSGGQVLLNGGVIYSRSAIVSVATPATDLGSGVSIVRLSNSPTVDASKLLTAGRSFVYTTPLSWSLANATYGGSTANGGRAVYVQWRDRAGNWSAVKLDRIVLDTVAPATQAPKHTFVRNTVLDTATVPVQISWAAIDTTSRIASYELQQRTSTTAFASVELSSPTARSTMLMLTPGTTYAFRMRATDGAGNVSAWVNGPGVRALTYQESSSTIAYAPAGAWTTSAQADAYGGSLRSTSARSATASFTFTGSQFALVAPVDVNKGRAAILVDGVQVSVVDLYSATPAARRIVFNMGGLSTTTPHTVQVRALGTKNVASSGTQVSIDAFVKLP